MSENSQLRPAPFAGITRLLLLLLTPRLASPRCRPETDLSTQPKGRARKVKLARLLRRHTPMSRQVGHELVAHGTRGYSKKLTVTTMASTDYENRKPFTKTLQNCNFGCRPTWKWNLWFTRHGPRCVHIGRARKRSCAWIGA